MLIRVVKDLMRLSNLRNLGTPVRTFYGSALLAQKKGRQETCPESGESDCSEVDDSPPQFSACANKRNLESGHAKDSKKPPPAFKDTWDTYKGKQYVKPVVEWDFPKEICCPQCEAFRFDVLYYKPGNKNRTYQRTWWECTPRMVPKRVCCWCDAVPPHTERRMQTKAQTQEKPQAKIACTAGHEKKRMDRLDKSCPQLRMPYCRVSRSPPSCKIFPTPSDCEKTKCPFPSYSECIQQDPAVIPGRPPECRCLEFNPICVQLRWARHMAKHNISIFPCDRGKDEKDKKDT
ncbi:uncharacterized protein LOC110177910 [Drosophila serrata]|uniref:uncharacterized protein LOC110177910 n=1 Tax=Drosophila serrata TaxID=7274 RepID=UPI000A1CF99D|nr:uncharacterized protein LOC110177910 [Drosophila serrata]